MSDTLTAMTAFIGSNNTITALQVTGYMPSGHVAFAKALMSNTRLKSLSIKQDSISDTINCEVLNSAIRNNFGLHKIMLTYHGTGKRGGKSSYTRSAEICTKITSRNKKLALAYSRHLVRKWMHTYQDDFPFCEDAVDSALSFLPVLDKINSEQLKILIDKDQPAIIFSAKHVEVKQTICVDEKQQKEYKSQSELQSLVRSSCISWCKLTFFK